MQSLHTATHCDFELVNSQIHIRLLVKLANEVEPVVWSGSFELSALPEDLEERAAFLELQLSQLSHFTIAKLARDQAIVALNKVLLDAGLDG